VIAGMEAHVCVMQTALVLKESGYDVYVVHDATGSRKPNDHAAAMTRMLGERVRIVTTEMVLFEWLKRADTPGFRDVLDLIR
jgi:nicotinamidase-related amidase